MPEIRTLTLRDDPALADEPAFPDYLPLAHDPAPRLASPTSAARIFQQPWWLQAAGGGDLECAEVSWDGRIVARLHFVRVKAFGFRLLRLPPYTRTHGPILSLPASKPAKYSRNLRRAVHGLIDALPSHERFQILLDPDDPCVFPFALAGCQVEQDFTFRLPAHTHSARHLADMDPKTRNLITSASRKLQVEQTYDIELFLSTAHHEHPRSNTHNVAAIRRIARAALQRGQLTLLSAVDFAGRVAATVVLVWDHDTLFLWQSARNPDLPIPGANSLLIHAAVDFALSRGLTFDLDGSPSLSAALFATRFGLLPVARPSIIHMSSWGYFAKHIALALGRRPGKATLIRPNL